MPKRLFVSLLFVAAITSQCIGAEEYKSEGWKTDKSSAVLKYNLKYKKKEQEESQKGKVTSSANIAINGRVFEFKEQEESTAFYYRLAVHCDSNTVKLNVSIDGKLPALPTAGTTKANIRLLPVTYQYNKESKLQEIWSGPWEEIPNKKTFNFISSDPKGFAQKLLKILEDNEDGKAQLVFSAAQVGVTLNFNVQGGVPHIKPILNKCKALPTQRND